MQPLTVEVPTKVDIDLKRTSRVDLRRDRKGWTWMGGKVGRSWEE